MTKVKSGNDVQDQVVDESLYNKVPMTVSVKKSVKTGLKVYAAVHDTSVSSLIENWYESLIANENVIL